MLMLEVGPLVALPRRWVFHEWQSLLDPKQSFKKGIFGFRWFHSSDL